MKRIIYFSALLMALVAPVSAQAKFHWTIDKLVKHAHGDPFACDIPPRGTNHYGPKQLRCVVRVVNRRNPQLARETELVIPCESGWDWRQVTPPDSASGLGQFLPSTWRSLPRWISSHSVFHPVWNVRGIRQLRLSAHRWSGPWLASKYCHHLR